MPIYEYKGQQYELADGLSNEQALGKIKTYLGETDEPEVARGRPTMANDPRRTDVQQGPSALDALGRQAAMTGRTLYEAFTSPASAALDFGSGLYNLGANLAGSDSRLPYASQRQAAMLNQMGAPVPETTAEKFAQGGIAALGGQAGLAKAAPAAAGSLARSLPAAAAGGAIAEPAAELTTDITGNQLLGTAAGLGASLVAGGAAGKAGGMLEAKAPTFSIPEVRARAAASYAEMDKQGVTLKPKSALDMVSRMRSALDDQNFIPETDTKVANALNKFESIIGTERVPFNKIEKLRSIATNLSNDPDANTRRLGKTMVDELDGYISSLNGRDVMTGKEGVDKAVKAVMDARKDWRAASKAQIIEDAFNVAEARANNPKKSESELIRNQIEAILANKTKSKMFSTAEQNAMRSIVQGGPVENLLTVLSRFDPRKSHLSAAGAGGAVVYDPVIGGSLAVGGMAADAALGASKRKQAQQLIRAVTSGTAEDVPNYRYSGLLGGYMGGQ